MLELLVIGGMPLPQALRLLIPPAWQTADNLDADLRAFSRVLRLPPGALGRTGRPGHHRRPLGGLRTGPKRPAAGPLDPDGRPPLIVASETGVVDVPVEDVAPGAGWDRASCWPPTWSKAAGEPNEIDDRLKTLAPWQDWLKAGVRYLDSELVDVHMAADPFDGYAGDLPEDVQPVARRAARSDPGAGGNPVRSNRIDGRRHADAGAVDPHPFALRQLPPAVRPGHEPSDRQPARADRDVLETGLGRKGNVFTPTAEMAERVVLNSPVLSQRKLRQLINTPQFGLPSVLLDLNVPRTRRWTRRWPTSADAPPRRSMTASSC
jgi:glutamate synthase (NADPH/NADH) large chain